MTRYLYAHEIRIFDHATKFAGPLRLAVRENAEAIAKENGLRIEFISNSGSFRKEKRVQKIIEARGDHPGLVHILFLSCDEPTCYYTTYRAHAQTVRLDFAKSGGNLSDIVPCQKPTAGTCHDRIRRVSRIDNPYALCYIVIESSKPKSLAAAPSPYFSSESQTSIRR